MGQGPACSTGVAPIRPRSFRIWRARCSRSRPSDSWLTAPRDVERAAAELPATLFLFDLLAFDEFDLRPLPLVERKRLLSRLVPTLGPIRAVDHVEGKRSEEHTSELQS